MQFGYFDNENREYVITNPKTPAPWANYLGSPEYGALISNNAGGYSFAKSGANGRILRYVFNNFDQPGRYIYIRDNDSKDYWSASWQERAWIRIRVSAIMVFRIRRLWQITVIFTQRHCIMCH
mgnify:CR=1 FL=1